MMLNLKEAFTYMFKQEKLAEKYMWGTLFILFSVLPLYRYYDEIMEGSLFACIAACILCFIVFVFPLGYALIYANSKINENNENLPEWTGNMGNIVENSIKYYVGFGFFVIPSSIIMGIIGLIVAIICAIAAVLLVGGDAINANPHYLYAAAGLMTLGIAIIMLPIVIIWHFLFILAHSSFLNDLKILSFLNFKRMFSLVKKNFLNLLILFLITSAFSICANVLFYKLPVVFFTLSALLGFYFLLVFYNLYAQFVQISLKKQAENDNLNPQEEQKSEEQTNQNQPQE